MLNLPGWKALNTISRYYNDQIGTYGSEWWIANITFTRISSLLPTGSKEIGST